MSFRHWITLVTFILLGIVIYFAWPEIVKAVGLVERIDVWILLLIIPVQLLSYYATGGIIFSYLRRKGNLKEVSHWKVARLSLELNFVNHILPSGGAAGFSYLGWVLSRFGVTPGRATVAQLIRFVLTFVTFVLLLIIAVIILAYDGHINRVILMLCGLIAGLAIGGTLLLIVIISSRSTLVRFSSWATRSANRIVAWATRGRKRKAVKEEILEKFFLDMHTDYIEVRRDMRVLIVPLVWAVLANICDVALLCIAFWALGTPVNPAAVFIAFGLSSIGGAISNTPGGAGAYEAIMIAFLASAGIDADVAIAGTLLARVTLVIGTIVFGYLFYQLTINKYGKHPA
jgi:uncharacterized protein (TIRG00374 family)